MKNMKTFIRILTVCLAVWVFIPSVTMADQSEAALISSMENRLPSLMELKLAGKVGETNLALVDVRGTVEREERKLISAENADRRAHYALIAARLKLPVRTVQLKRAEQLRENSPKGIWIETETGVWYRK